MNEIVLKPCPFCGGDAKFYIKNLRQIGDMSSWEFGIFCNKCGITTPKTNYVVEIQLDGFGNIETISDQRPIATEAWNRRAYDEQRKAD